MPHRRDSRRRTLARHHPVGRLVPPSGTMIRLRRSGRTARPTPGGGDDSLGRWRRAACALPAGVLVAVAALLVTVPDLRGAAGMVRHVPPFTDLLQVTATADCGAPDAGRIGSVASMYD